MINRVSLAELASAQIRLRPPEAVALVSEICRQNLAGIVPGIPSAAVIRLLPDGGLTIEGPVRASHNDVAGAATLLSTLLPGFDAPPEFRASGGLRLLIARALGTLDLPPFQSLEDFTAALARFTTLDATVTAATLFKVWQNAVVPAKVVARTAPEVVDLELRTPDVDPPTTDVHLPASRRWPWAVSAALLLEVGGLSHAGRRAGACGGESGLDISTCTGVVVGNRRRCVEFPGAYAWPRAPRDTRVGVLAGVRSGRGPVFSRAARRRKCVEGRAYRPARRDHAGLEHRRRSRAELPSASVA
jgi:hypothetical protein